jgi:hypothetical protein
LDDIQLYARAGEMITPVAPDNAGLLAQYSLEGNANDSSGNGLNGAVTNGQFVTGNSALGLELTGTGNVDLGNPAQLDFDTGNWTITAWFKTGMTGTSEAERGTILAKGGDGSGGHRYAFILGESSEGIVSLVCDDNNSKSVVDSTTLTNDDQWHCVTGQREGTEIRIFVDGQLEATETVGTGYDLSGTSQHKAYIGSITNNASGTIFKMFDGVIDEVALYERALSSGEILWLAGRTTPFHKPF